jgi:ADP-ribosylglycohydrolase
LAPRIHLVRAVHTDCRHDRRRPLGLKAGEWAYDTSMALCLAESLLECGAFDPVDQLSR